MTCDECFEAFSASVDGELAADQHEAMNEHLDDCADCQRLRGRLLSLTAEMKGQPFIEPDAEAARALAGSVLAAVRTSRWGGLRGLLRLPYESWPWRLGLRPGAFGSMTGLVALTLIIRWLLPPYTGAEASAKSGLPSATDWLAWLPAPGLAYVASALVLMLGAWTCGIPALLGDLWGEARLRHNQVANAMWGLVLLGPFAALPLVGELELGAYALICCLWTGGCLVAGFALIAVKTSRPLPRLALDFVALLVPLAALEWLARAAMSFPSGPELQPTVALLVGSLPFSTLAAGMGVLSLTLLLLGCGVSGMVPAYRGTGGRPMAAISILAALACALYGALEIAPQWALSPIKVEQVAGRQVYLLAAGVGNPWLLPAVEYAKLQVDVAGPGSDPRAARLRLASAYLDWDEPALLKALTDWADHAPGVAWGLSAFVDSLGQRQGSVLSLPTEERQRTVAHLLVQLRWRVLAEAKLSRSAGSVRGRIEGLGGRTDGLRLRLIPAKGGLTEASESLEQEISWARDLAPDSNLDADFSASATLRTALSGVSGEFTFPRVPPGRYVLALQTDKAAPLTFNSSLPGLFEVGEGELRLEPIRLSAGSEGENIPLEVKSWKTEGAVDFSVTSSGPVFRMAPAASASTFVDGGVFHSGDARVKIVTEGSSSAVLVAKVLAKDGRLIAEKQLKLRDGLQELEVSSDGREGYLQLVLSSERGPLLVNALRLEVLP